MASVSESVSRRTGIAPVKLVVGGYYGCGNLGDDALLVGFLTGLGNLPVKAVALSGAPERTNRVLGIQAIGRRDPAAFASQIEDADALVLAGGGLLQDVTSLYSLKYYTRLIRTAKSKGKKVILLAQGIGPITSFLGKRAAIQAFNDCDVISVRDQGSLSALRTLGYKRPVEVTGDLAWLVEPIETSEGGFGLGDMKTVGIAARPWRKNRNIAPAFAGFAQLLFKNQYVPVLVEMDSKLDTPLLDAISKLHGGRPPDMRNIQTPSALVARLKRMHAVVAMRLHAGILAASAGVPSLMVSYDPKVSAFASQMDFPTVSMEGLTADRLWDSFQRFEQDRARLVGLLEKKRPEQIALAKRNIDILIEQIPSLSGKS